MGLANPGKTRRLTGIGEGLTWQDPAGQIFGRLWKETQLLLLSELKPLAGYMGLLL
jgi:hypothetical protein